MIRKIFYCFLSSYISLLSLEQVERVECVSVCTTVRSTQGVGG